MCGISGFFNPNEGGVADKTTLSRMTEILVHRGPDESGYFLDDHVGLGNRRLSIVDLTTGRQPIHNEDESVWVTFNGEIYNFPDLRLDLKHMGHRFYTKTDTEVIVHAYEEYGESFVEKLNGMFAFALWDSRSKKILLCRDRLGIKPLYYSLLEDGTLLFGSEIKAVLEYPGFRRSLDKMGLHYVINLITFTPDDVTLFEGVKKILPGGVISYDKKGLRKWQYWTPQIRYGQRFTEEYYIQKFRLLFRKAVERQLVSDVPIGSFLSGGLDTSAVVAMASELYPHKLKTFTLGFGESTDELNDARIISNQFGTEHYEYTTNAREVVASIPQLIWQRDFPEYRGWPFIILSRVKKNVKVVLSGMGGDELFGGYEPRYRYLRQAGLYNRFVPKAIRHIFSGVSGFLSKQMDFRFFIEKKYLNAIENSDNENIYLSFTGALSQEDRRNLYGKQLTDAEFPEISSLLKSPIKNLSPGKENMYDKVFITDIRTYLTQDYLANEDALSMATSVEYRVPFLDNELLDFALSVPWDLKFKGQTGKYIMRKALAGTLPKYILEKEKHHFGASSDWMYYKNVKDQGVEDMLLKSPLIREGYLKEEAVRKIVKSRSNGLHPQERHMQMFLNIFCLDIFYKIYLNGDDDTVKKPDFDINRYL